MRSENDYWWDAKAHLGADAIIVADKVFGIGEAKKHFAAVEKLETLEVRALGRVIWKFDIWLGRSYHE